MINIPTISQLYTSIINDIQTEYGNTISPVGQVFLRPIAAVWAAKLRMQYINVARLQKNIFVDAADDELKGGTLQRFGRVKLGRNPFQAVAGQYVVEVTGSIGSVIPASTTFKSDDSSLNAGYLFILDNAYTLTATTDSITLRALTTGLDAKLNITDTLTSTTPIALVESKCSVLSITVQPLAEESLEDYRQKVIDSYRLEPQGGAATDYRIWASDAQGVKRVYPYAKSGAVCEIDLFVEATLLDSTDGKGTPSGTMLTDVEAVVNFNPNTSLALNERGRRPLQVIVHYLPVTIKTIEINISGFTAITPSIETQLFDAFKTLLSNIRPYVPAADLPINKNDILDNNKIIAAIINTVPGANFGAITFTVNGVPLPTYNFNQGNIPYLNAVTYV